MADRCAVRKATTSNQLYTKLFYSLWHAPLPLFYETYKITKNIIYIYRLALLNLTIWKVQAFMQIWWTKTFLRPFLFQARRLTCRIRLMPDFIIIGSQRCGTTSLFNYLLKHPCIAPSFKKEVHFFDNKFGRGINWYRAQFPTFLYRYYARLIQKRDLITWEKSPYYIFHPLAPALLR